MIAYKAYKQTAEVSFYKYLELSRSCRRVDNCIIIHKNRYLEQFLMSDQEYGRELPWSLFTES